LAIKQTHARQIFGLILIIIGLLLVLDNFDIDIFNYFWPGLIIVLGLYLLYRGARKKTAADSMHSEFRVFGDTSHTGFSGEIDGSELNHFIGDTELNLSGAQLKPGVNTLSISNFIGDIKVLIPEGMAVEVHCSGAFGDYYLLDNKEDGIFVSATGKTPGYDAAEKRLRINCSVFIGDIKVMALKSAGEN